MNVDTFIAPIPSNLSENIATEIELPFPTISDYILS